MNNLAADSLQIEALEQELRGASSEHRLRLQPKLDRALRSLESTGMAVPARLRNLHDQLLDEAIEARFDNLPI